MSPYGLIASSYVALTVCWVSYCLYTGLNPFEQRRWYDRLWRVALAALGSLLTVLFFFFLGDS